MIAALGDPLARWLPAFLPRQRWFGAKSRRITSCAMDDAVLLDAARRTVLAICRVEFEEGAGQRYALVLAPRRDPGTLPALGRLDEAGGEWIVEATADAGDAATLLRGFSRHERRATDRGGELVHADAGPTVAAVLGPDGGRPTPIGAEQSNTTLRIDRSYIFKLIRRLEPGENPEVEIGRFLLSRTSFRKMPPLEGSITYRAPSGEIFTLGMLQGWAESEGDGWAYTVRALTENPGRAVSPQLAGDMTVLGRATAELHAALASDPGTAAFAPDVVTPSDAADWIREVRTQSERSIGLLRSSAASLEASTRTLAERVLARTAGLERLLEGIRVTPNSDVRKTRIHGDFHLGQTLKTPSGFVLIDFEGEPARSVIERRQKTCVLKDVAGMLRSLDYAVETAAQGRDPGASPSSGALRAAFLTGYFESGRAAAVPLYPDREAERVRWLSLFEYGKAVYELEYELNNRPDWIAIPLQGVAALLGN